MDSQRGDGQPCFECSQDYAPTCDHCGEPVCRAHSKKLGHVFIICLKEECIRGYFRHERAGLEEEIVDSVSPEISERLLAATSAPGVPLLRRLADSVKSLINSSSSSVLPVLLCPSPARYHVKRWLEPLMPRLAVVAAAEVPAEIRLKPAGTVR